MARPRLVLLLFLVSIAATLALAFATTAARAEWALRETTYFMMWTCISLPACALWEMHRRGELPRPPPGPVVRALALSAALMTAIHFGVGNAYRILADETNLLATSLSFYTRQTATNITEALVYSDAFHVVSAGTPSRPCLYPFLVSLLHAPFGYAATHGFIVSGVAAATTLVAVATWGRRLAGEPFGAFSAVMVAALPVFQLAATSCGFESLNLCLIVLVAMQTCSLLERPSSLRAELLLATCILGAHCRYETALLVVPASLACCLRMRAIAAGPWSARVALYPLLTLPLFWQRRVTSVVNDGDSVTAPFSARFVSQHLHDLYELFWDPKNASYPTLRVITVLAVIGAIGLVVRASRDGKRRDSTGPVLVASGLALILLVQMAFYLGDLRLAFQSRFATSYAAGIGMVAAYPLQRAWARAGTLRFLVVALAAGTVWSGLARSNEDARGRSLLAFRIYERNLEVLSRYDAADTLVIGDRPGTYTAQHYGAVSEAYAASHRRELAQNLERGEIRTLLLLRESRCGEPVEGLELGSNTEQNVVREYNVQGTLCEHVVEIRARRAPAVVPDGEASRRVASR